MYYFKQFDRAGRSIVPGRFLCFISLSPQRKKTKISYFIYYRLFKYIPLIFSRSHRLTARPLTFSSSHSFPVSSSLLRFVISLSDFFRRPFPDFREISHRRRTKLPARFERTGFCVWCSVFCVWCSVFCVLCLVFSVLCFVFGV